MSDAPPIIDWSKDIDVIQMGKITDAQALKRGWCDAKVAGVFSCHIMIMLVAVNLELSYPHSI
jgi:hypothetical protein